MQRDFLIRVLGPVDILTPDGAQRVGSRSMRALLALLALAAGRSVSIDQLRSVIWQEDPPPSADSSLHTYVSRLRHVLGPNAIERTDHSYRLAVTRDQIDATRFEDLLDEASAAQDAPERSVELCRAALDLWRGEPFGDLGDDDPFRLEGLRLDDLRLAVMELALAAEIELGRHEIAAAELASAVREYPYRERLWYLLAEALLRDERRVEALRTCEALRSTLADAGLEPGTDLIELERRILGTTATPTSRPTHW